MTPREQWKDLLSGVRAERDAYRKRSTFWRKEWQRLKKERKFQEALTAMSRMHEYAATARERQSFIDENKWRIA